MMDEPFLLDITYQRFFRKCRTKSGGLFPAKRWDVGPIVSAIGKAAGVVVDERQRGKETVRKFTSAHDLRRSFGSRWAGRVMPTVLRELMRHSSINTTMAYYVGMNAEATAETLWAESGNILGNTRPDQKSRRAQKA
jgi:integrase